MCSILYLESSHAKLAPYPQGQTLRRPSEHTDRGPPVDPAEEWISPYSKLSAESTISNRLSSSRFVRAAMTVRVLQRRRPSTALAPTERERTRPLRILPTDLQART